MARYYVFLLRRSCRFEFKGLQHLEEIEGNRAIYGIWHQDILTLLAFLRIPTVTIVSRSRDGDLLSHLIEQFGHRAFRGSSSRGGEAGLRDLVRMLKRGSEGEGEGLASVMAHDGPRGPAYIPKKGIFTIAKLTGYKILPVSFHPQRAWVSKKSWDNFRLPQPFSSVQVHYKRPIEVAPDASKQEIDRLSERLREALTET